MGPRRAERVGFTRVLLAVCLAAAPQGSTCMVRVYQNSDGESANVPTLFESEAGFGPRGPRISNKIHQVTQLVESPFTEFCSAYGQKLKQQVSQGFPAGGRGGEIFRTGETIMATWADKESITACRAHLYALRETGGEWPAVMNSPHRQQPYILPDLGGLRGTVEMQGFAGHLDLATPDVYGCSALPPIRPWWSREHPYHMFQWWTMDEDRKELPRAVLIARSVESDPELCTFETKVRNAYAAGYSLVIVYDSEPGPLFKMATTTEMEIPSVLVSYSSGLALTALIDASIDPNGPIVSVDNPDRYLRGACHSDGMFVVNIMELILICHVGFVFAAVVNRLLRWRLYPNGHNRSTAEEAASGSLYSTVDGGMVGGAGNLSTPLLSSAPTACTGVA